MTCRNFTLVFHQFATSVNSSEKEAHNELFKQIQDFKTEIKFPKNESLWMGEQKPEMLHEVENKDFRIYSPI